MDPIQKAQRLRDITAKYRVLKYDPVCVRKKSNVGTLEDGSFEKWYLEHPDNLIDPEFVSSMRHVSPKLHKLLKTIEYLDAKDQREHGHMFKHFIFSDIKSSTKLLAAGLVASGFRIGVKPVIGKKGKKKGKPIGIKLLSEQELAQEKALPGCKGHFDLMASGSVFSKAMTVPQKKQLFARFNARDDSPTYSRNNHGEQVRIKIMDNGFKEGVDLFDVKYVHIFEPQVTMADSKQVIGRGTRTCGQKGLTFDPERGWPLHVYVYDLDLGTSKSSFLNAGSAFDLYLKALNIDLRLFKLNDEFEQLMMEGSVDYELNKAVHEFRGKADKELDYSWSRSASPEIPFKLLESSEKVLPDADLNDYKYQVVVYPAKKGADKLLNSLFGGDYFVKGNGFYANNSYYVDMRIYEVTIYFKYVRSFHTIGEIVRRIGDALDMQRVNYARPEDTDKYVIKLMNRETGDWLAFEDMGSSYTTVGSYASSKKSVQYNSDGDSIMDRKSKSESVSLDIDDDDDDDEDDDEDWPENNSDEFGWVQSWMHKDSKSPTSDSEDSKSPTDNEDSKSPSIRGGANIQFTPTQGFVSNYFTPQNPIKGMLLNHSVGTGKTCTAIATATGSFEPQGYTILWVTRTTLRNDIWKNMFDMVCHHGLMNRSDMPTTQTERMKLLSKSWSIRPISY